MVFRCDSAPLGRVERTPAGGLRIPATVAREGVLVYPWGREYVPRTTLEASFAQLNGLPVALRHPISKRVDSHNWSSEAVGHAGEDAWMDGIFQGVTIYVQRADAVASVENGLTRQLSMGYDVALDPTPGISPAGERYDAVQTARTYNHIALVPAARGGPGLALRLDSAGDAVIDYESDPAMSGVGGTMRQKLRIDGIEYEVEAPESFFQAYDLAKTRQDAMMRAEKARADEAEGKIAGLEKNLADERARADAASDPRRLDERIAARAALEAAARRVLGDKIEFVGKTDRQVMELVVRSDEGDDLSQRSDDWIRGAFDARTASVKPMCRDDSLDRARRIVTAPRRDEQPTPLAAAIARLRQNQAEAACRPFGGNR